MSSWVSGQIVATKRGDVVIVNLRCVFEKDRHRQHFATLPLGFRPRGVVFTTGYVHYMTGINQSPATSAMTGMWVENSGIITLDIDRNPRFYQQEYKAIDLLATLVFSVN